MSEVFREITGSLRALLSDREVVFDPGVISSYRVSNPIIQNGRLPGCVVKPGDAGRLQALVGFANEKGLGLVPVSSGAPHGKGGTLCAQEHAIVDLSHWKKIDLIDRRNRVCRIEPGVTYGELLEALQPQGMTVSMPLAPRSEKSVLAAVMDREPTTWPNKQRDAGDPVGSTEVVFGAGDVFRTGAAGGPGSIEKQRSSGGAQKAPMGPSQTDFHRLVQGAQGSIGIVNWITIRCEVMPTRQEPRLVGAEPIEELIPFVYQVQRPWLGEHSFILDRNAAALLMDQGQPGAFDRIRGSLHRFVCLQNIAGFERLPRERVAYQMQDLEARAANNGLSLVESLGQLRARDLLAAATAPGGERDWRQGRTGNCLSLFFLTTLDRAPGFIETFEELLRKHQLYRSDYGIYLQPLVQNHCCHVEFLFPFESDGAQSLDQLRGFEAEAVPALAEQGAFFSRPYGAAAQEAFTRNQLNLRVLQKVKKIFDPHGVLNPGKFGL